MGENLNCIRNVIKHLGIFFVFQSNILVFGVIFCLCIACSCNYVLFSNFLKQLCIIFCKITRFVNMHCCIGTHSTYRCMTHVGYLCMYGKKVKYFIYLIQTCL